MRRRISLVFVLGLLMAGCGTDPSASSTAVEPEQTALPATPRESSAQATFPSGPPPDGCVRPPSDVTSVIEQQTDPLGCYGGADLTDCITGHFDDPAAQVCLYRSYPAPGPPSPDEVIGMCRGTFVIIAMKPLES